MCVSLSLWRWFGDPKVIAPVTNTLRVGCTGFSSRLAVLSLYVAFVYRTGLLPWCSLICWRLKTPIPPPPLDLCECVRFYLQLFFFQTVKPNVAQKKKKGVAQPRTVSVCRRLRPADSLQRSHKDFAFDHTRHSFCGIFCGYTFICFQEIHFLETAYVEMTYELNRQLFTVNFYLRVCRCVNSSRISFLKMYLPHFSLLEALFYIKSY